MCLLSEYRTTLEVKGYATTIVRLDDSDAIVTDSFVRITNPVLDDSV